MLTGIHVRNLAVVDEIEVEPAGGMTALTGETGAGKSILVDALGLVLGDRADSGIIRHGCERAEISATFDISGLSSVHSWLAEQDLDHDDECLLRRVISRGGRSRGYINGQPATMQLLRTLGEQLVDIHGQHEHQSLLQPALQRSLLDGYGKHRDEVTATADCFRAWQSTRKTLDATLGPDGDRDARLDLLRYQLQELEALQLDAGEIGAIDTEHKRAANAGRLLQACRDGLARLDSDADESAASLVNRTLDELSELSALDSRLDEACELLNTAAIHINECIDTLRAHADSHDIDDERLHWLEQRIHQLHDLARKHRCRPEQLPAVEQAIRSELDTLEHADEHRIRLEQQLDEQATAYRAAALKLGRARSKAAKALGKEITRAMQTLGMAGGSFEAAVERPVEPRFSIHGDDRVEFRVTANRGQPLQALAKVASGGELSRISLAIQVISTGSDCRPTLIFDEVDSGIGGGTAEVVGQRLRELAAGRQVLCVTHLPQVAAQAHQQLQVSKQSTKKDTRTTIKPLSGDMRVEEVARMLGGLKITTQARDTAREMILSAEKPVRKPRKRTSRANA